MGNEGPDDVLIKHYQNRYNKLKNEYDELQAQAQRMVDALDSIGNGPFPITQRELEEWLLKTKSMARESLQQFKDGKGKDEPKTTEAFNPDKTIICAECNTRPAVIDYNGHGFYVCKSCDDSLNKEFDKEYQ